MYKTNVLKSIKKATSFILVLVMLAGLLPLGALSFGAQAAAADDYMRIYHVDCGRKYFSVTELKGIIDMLSENNYNYLELAIGNNGLRFLLDDMSVSANGKTYTDDDVTAAIQAGNKNYTTASTGELTESEMTELITYAAGKGIEIIPLLNSPGHMNALLYAINKLDNANYAYDGSSSTVDVTNSSAVALTQAIIDKYITWFAAKGCSYFNIGADECRTSSNSKTLSAVWWIWKLPKPRAEVMSIGQRSTISKMQAEPMCCIKKWASAPVKNWMPLVMLSMRS